MKCPAQNGKGCGCCMLPAILGLLCYDELLPGQDRKLHRFLPSGNDTTFSASMPWTTQGMHPHYPAYAFPFINDVMFLLLACSSFFSVHLLLLLYEGVPPIRHRQQGIVKVKG